MVSRRRERPRPSRPSLDHRHPAIDVQCGAGDPPGLIGSQIDDGGGDVFRLPKPAQRDRLGQFGLCASLSTSVIAVTTKPGATTLTVIPREATSCASALLMPTRPAFAAA